MRFTALLGAKILLKVWLGLFLFIGILICRPQRVWAHPDGQEVGNGGTVLIKGKEYLLIDTLNLPSIPHERFELGPRFIESLGNIERVLDEEFQMGLENFFAKEIFSADVEFRFVERLPVGCIHEGADLIGCTRSRITYILSGPFSKLGLLRQSLKLIELRLTVFSPLAKARAHLILPKLYETLVLLFEKVILSAGNYLNAHELGQLTELKSLIYAVLPNQALTNIKYYFTEDGRYDVKNETQSLPEDEEVDLIYVDGASHYLTKESVGQFPAEGKITFGPRLTEKINELAKVMDKLDLPLGRRFVDKYIHSGDFQIVRSFAGKNCHFVDLQDFEWGDVDTGPGHPAPVVEGAACTIGNTTYIRGDLFAQLPPLHRALTIYHERAHVRQNQLTVHDGPEDSSEEIIMRMISGLHILANKFWNETYHGRFINRRSSPYDRGLNEEEMQTLENLPRYVSYVTGDSSILSRSYHFTREGGVLINSSMRNCVDCFAAIHTVLINSQVSGEHFVIRNSTLKETEIFVKNIENGWRQMSSISSSSLEKVRIGEKNSPVEDLVIRESVLVNSNLGGQGLFLINFNASEVSICPYSQKIHVQNGDWKKVEVHAANLKAEDTQLVQVHIGNDQRPYQHLELLQSTLENTKLLADHLKSNRAKINDFYLSGENITLSGVIKSSIFMPIDARDSEFDNFTLEPGRDPLFHAQNTFIPPFPMGAGTTLKVQNSRFVNTKISNFRFDYDCGCNSDEIHKGMHEVDLENVALFGVSQEVTFLEASGSSYVPGPQSVVSPLLCIKNRTRLKNIQKFVYERKKLIFGQDNESIVIDGCQQNYCESNDTFIQSFFTVMGHIPVINVPFVVGKYKILDHTEIDSSEDLEDYLVPSGEKDND